MAITDRDIAAMSARERVELIERLRGSVPDQPRVPGPGRRGNRRRRIALGVAAVSSVLLVPWVVYLAFHLPERHLAPNWTLTWVGFDIGLILLFALTAFLAWKRRILVVLTAFAAGFMLLADAWFDTTTAGSDGRLEAILSAVLIEIPLAIFLISMSLHLLWRVSSLLASTVRPGASAHWRARIQSDVLDDH
ncbi:hypothetical protein [Leekyejoonella antrihumi]|uniref:Uncharacterized protein n=1 Tax=Leekyejoonella antrihumi TaxID=1660198 RepID=A0A563DVU6_9MICO|nr:hypothetical protein [Leekyejoonella antrihumi]TWP34315.1 hypothetical protein FGL98_17950 [Leekyejoonella antrihumi]